MKNIVQHVASKTRSIRTIFLDLIIVNQYTLIYTLCFGFLQIMTLTLTQNNLIKYLAYTQVFIILMHLLTQSVSIYTGHDVIMGAVPLFNLNAEVNIPTLYSTLLLFFASILLFILGSAYKNIDRWFTKYWYFLSLIFFFLTIDEFSSIHERLGDFTRQALNTTGYLHFAWVIPYAIIVIIIGILLLKFLLKLDKSIAKGFVISGAIFVFGAIGLEILGAKEAFESGQNSLLFIGLSTIEEIMEMSGVLLFIFYLLKSLSLISDSMTLQLTNNLNT